MNAQVRLFRVGPSFQFSVCTFWHTFRGYGTADMWQFNVKLGRIYVLYIYTHSKLFDAVPIYGLIIIFIFSHAMWLGRIFYSPNINMLTRPRRIPGGLFFRLFIFVSFAIWKNDSFSVLPGSVGWGGASYRLSQFSRKFNFKFVPLSFPV